MNKKRVLIVGVGSIGERHIRCFYATGRADVGICELNDMLRNTIKDRYQVNDSFSSLDQALVEKWDAAVVATPAHTHIGVAHQLAQSGVHLLIEKPLSTSMDGINELSEVISERGLHCAVAYVYRAHPGLAAMRDKINSGFIGKPLNLVVKSGQCFPFYRPGYKYTYYKDHARGGGAIQDSLTHHFNIAEWLIGPIHRVCADADHLAIPGVEVEDTAHVLARQGDAMSVITMNQFQPVNETTVDVHGDAGSVQLVMHDSCWRWANEPGGVWQTQGWEPFDRDYPFLTQANAFLDVIEHNNKPLCTLSEGIQTLRVNLAALRSAHESHGWEEIGS